MASCLPFLCFLFFLFTLSKGNVGNDAIKRLEGSRKGSKVEGLHALKLYLARFGYLNYQHTPNHANAQDDEFDDELEAALKTYQTFYHLNVSGSLDGPTISQMLMPRCGQPDHVKPHQHGTKLLHTVSHYAFFGPNYKWPPTKTHLTYAFGPDYPNAYIAPVVQAFETWASASEYFTFSNVDDIQGADLKISFKRGDHGDGYPFGKGPEALAHAFAPTDGRFHYNADYKWSVGPGPVQDAFDLGSVALHEIGHLLGLEHSEDPNATMYSGIPPATIKGLNSDDIQGIKVLYGVPN